MQSIMVALDRTEKDLRACDECISGYIGEDRQSQTLLSADGQIAWI